MASIILSEIFQTAGNSPLIQLSHATRSLNITDATELYIDQFDHASAVSIRLHGDNRVTLLGDQAYRFETTEAGGYLGRPFDPQQPFLWLPSFAVERELNSDQQILSEQEASLQALEWQGQHASFTFQVADNSSIDVIIWRFPADFPIEELTLLFPVEIQGYFLWGSHSCIKHPADLYRHLIHGAVYDLRYSWPHNKKCFSENEAHALYTVYSGLEKTTDKPLYRFFQLQLVLSVMQRQSEDGGFYHGMWTDSSECHYRLHTSAIHLLLDEFQRSGCEQVKASLEKAVAFLSKTTDQLDCGIWFLHDSLELSEEAMNNGPFEWIPNRALGKSISNMLVLNTHLDSTIAINRYGQLTGDQQYQGLVDSALQSTRAVLDMQPANWLYKPLFWAIGLTMLPTEKAEKLPVPVRAIKRIAWKYLIKWLPDIKARFPRLVMPNGYIDRELSLRTWAIDYQTINLMDLARYARAFPNQFDESILDKAMAFTHSSGLIKRYRELQPGKRYAPGFWMEALYHRCLAKPDVKYRHWLAEAMLECHELGLGMAPSLLGGNGEAISYSTTPASPIMVHQEILVANLSTPQHVEFLFVNTTNTELPFIFTNNPDIDLKWLQPDSSLAKKPAVLAPKGWIIGKKVG